MSEIFVIGHRNPDTDSICSAIAYTYLKNTITEEKLYVAKRTGEINSETKFVLDYFGLNPPDFLHNVRTQIKDINLKKPPLISPEISLRKAWDIMKKNETTTLPVSKNGSTLDGLITVGYIAQSSLDIFENKVLAQALTPYKNIVEVLDGELIVGDINDIVKSGQILIGAMTPDTMENFLGQNDIVILGNRYETQMCAIQMGAQCIIITGGLPVSASIKKLAESSGCAIITSPHDTYIVVRLITQSVPIGYYMKSGVVSTFNNSDYIDDIRDIMVKKRFRNFPVVDDDNNYLGMLSRALLIDLKKKRLILVDHNEKSQSAEGLEEAEILEIIDHHRIGDIETVGPVYFRNQPVGCTATIICNMYREHNVEVPKSIAGILCSAILSDTLIFKSPTCTSIDKSAAEYLAAIAEIDIAGFSKKMFRAGSNLVNKEIEEIFYQDFKQFKAGKFEIGVAQINSMDSNELEEIKDSIKEYIKKVHQEKGMDMILVMLTDIINENTELLFEGDKPEIIAAAFNGTVKDNSILLPGVVSRKKQVIPPILNTVNHM